MANTGPVWAEETIRDRWSKLTAQGARNLTLLATGDEGAAQDAMTEKIMEEMRQNRKPEL